MVWEPKPLFVGKIQSRDGITWTNDARVPEALPLTNTITTTKTEIRSTHIEPKALSLPATEVAKGYVEDRVPGAVFPGGKTIASMCLEVTDVMLRPYHPLSTDEVVIIRDLAMNTSLNSLADAMAYGVTEQKKDGAIADQMVVLTTLPPLTVGESLRYIRDTIKTLDPNILLTPPKEEKKGWSFFKNDKPKTPRELLDEGITMLDVKVADVWRQSSTLQYRIDILTNCMVENLKNLRSINALVVAGELMARHIRDVMLPSLAKGINEQDIVGATPVRDLQAVLKTIEARVESLRDTRISMTGTIPQLELILGNYTKLQSLSQDTIAIMVTEWKKHYGTVLMLLDNKQNALATNAIRAVMVEQDKITSALEDI